MIKKSKKTKTFKSKAIPVFVIDDSVLVSIIEGDNSEKAKDVFEIITKMKHQETELRKIKVVTTINSLLRSIWKAKPDVPIKHLQDIIEVFDIAPSKKHEYKDEKKVKTEIIMLANMMADPVGYLQKMVKNGKVKST